MGECLSISKRNRPIGITSHLSIMFAKTVSLYLNTKYNESEIKKTYRRG